GNPQRGRRQGLGLGLAIVNRIADLLGHDIGVRSRLGRGSRFSVTLNRVEPTTAGTPEEPAVLPDNDGLRGCCVLVLDDDKYILDAMQSLLRSWGVEVLCAASIEAASDLLESVSLKPELLLVDYRLQDRNSGIQAIDTLQQLLGDNVPAVLLTGDTAPDRLRQAQASGIPLLHKPVQPARLRALLRSFLSNDAGRGNLN
ncbi:MAG: response regulator, partial [Gammaproteobacteria bacterium]|nr:response regulator [Gammaproteobacteria bacterium]